MKKKGKLVFFIGSVLSAVLVYYNGANNNVCRSYSDYFFIHSSNNCWHEPGYYAEVPQIILQRNSSLETFYTVTDDGYILKTFRILPKTEPKAVIFMEHSFVANSEIWVDKGDSSLGLYLLDRGYEIWLGNLRGSKYSNTHLKYTMDDFEFWNWSFHEQGIYDIKSQLELVKKITKKSIIYISYSMAGTSSIAYASLNPDHAKNNLKAIINIGPVMHITNMRGIAVELAKVLRITRTMEFLHWVGIGWLPHGRVLKFVKGILCSSHPFKSICITAHEPLIGYSKTEFDAAAAPIVLEKFPDAASTKSILHYKQIYFAGGRMRMYDYGVEKNIGFYNSSVPPLYPLRNINVPVFTYYGSEDFFTTPKDVQNFYSELSPEAKRYGHKEIKDYNHFDLMFGRNREKDIYQHLLQLLKVLR